MTSPPHVDKADIVATLRSRGRHARADWVDREPPVDIDHNAALLRTLDIDPAVPWQPPTPHRGNVKHERARES
jgi:hypothetical protein